jgi:hypothetical protein
MKKIVLFVFFLGAISVEMFSQRNTTAPEIDQFLTSPEFNRVINDPQWSRLGTVNRALSYATVIQENPRGIAVNIVIERGRDHRVTAVIEAVKAPVGNDFFPNNEGYAMVLRNYENYNFATSSGIIEYYDLNYENHHAGTITVSKSSVVNWVTYPIPQNVMDKYSNLTQRAHYCDKNQNGNVTFTECYQCMKNACASNAGCDTLCDILNITVGFCTASMAVSCVYISMVW